MEKITKKCKKTIMEATLRKGNYGLLRRLLEAGGREIVGDLFLEYLKDMMWHQRKVNELRSKMIRILNEKEVKK